MAEKAKEKKDGTGLHIHLTGNKYIVGDSYSFWIVSESKRKNKDGKQTIVRTRLSGYHTDFADLVGSYFQDRVKASEIDGELEDLAKVFVKYRNEIRGWWSRVDKALKEGGFYD